MFHLRSIFCFSDCCTAARLPRGARVRAVLVGLVLLALPALVAAQIRVASSDLLGPAFREAVAAFARDYQLEITIEMPGSRPAMDKLRDGTTDLVIVAQAPGDAALVEPMVGRIFAYQPIVVIVPEALPLSQITFTQLHGIFALGALDSFASWGMIGLTGDWRTRAIAPHILAASAGITQTLAQRLIFNGGAIKPTVTQAANLEQLGQRVRAADGSIGLTSRMPSPGSGLRALAVAATMSDAAYLPTPENLQGSYQLRLPLLLALRRESGPQLQPLLQFLLSDECAAAMAKDNFIQLPRGPRRQLALELEQLR